LKFIADGMFGKITRWLRIIGYNVKYSRNLCDRDLIVIAKKEKRILLTRDLELFRMSINNCVKAFFLEGETDIEKLIFLSRNLKIEITLDEINSRCPKCNNILKRIRKKDVVNILNQKTLKYHEKFWKCNKCGKIYWHGSHWKNIKKTIKSVNELIQKERNN
jgi:uncharacterized protein with PIN domain